MSPNEIPGAAYLAIIESSYGGGYQRAVVRFVLPECVINGVQVSAEWYYLNRLDANCLLITCFPESLTLFRDYDKQTSCGFENIRSGL
jgi:hypothetical protein